MGERATIREPVRDPRYLGLVREYRRIYGAGSVFVHASSTASRLYRVGNDLRQVADARHVSRFGTLAALLALRLHGTSTFTVSRMTQVT